MNRRLQKLAKLTKHPGQGQNSDKSGQQQFGRGTESSILDRCDYLDRVENDTRHDRDGENWQGGKDRALKGFAREMCDLRFDSVQNASSLICLERLRESLQENHPAIGQDENQNL